MFNRIIEFSIRHRLVVLGLAALLAAYGTSVVVGMPVDVLPNLNRPVVTVLTEAHGMVPEEVEALVTIPIEAVVNGAADVRRVRSASSQGLSIVWVEFDWGANILQARQIVSEKLQLSLQRLPDGLMPTLGPVSSIMGEIMLIGITSENDATDPMELRSLAEWVIRPRLMTLEGVSQVITIGGELRQLQVLTSPDRLQRAGVTLDELTTAVRESNLNASGGFIVDGAVERTIRIRGRVRQPEDVAKSVVVVRRGTPITVGQVADVHYAAAVKRGDASINAAAAVILSVQKQPQANTLDLTAEIDRVVVGLQDSLPDGVRVDAHLFRQATFIEAAIGNVEEALGHGSLLVFVVLFVFLASLRPTIISLIAIPLSLLVAMLVVDQMGVAVNTMTLGGLAVAIGLVVDDSIVGVENVVRRLRENHSLEQPVPPLTVVYRATTEVRNSIVFATVIIVLVFLPLLSLEGMEGRVFAPLTVAFITALTASLLVSLTVTPALCSLLLVRKGGRAAGPIGDGWLVRRLKRIAEPTVRWSLHHSRAVMGVSAVLVVGAGALFPLMGREFLPRFNEGSYTINTILPPGTSLEESNRLGTAAERALMTIPEVSHVGRRTGRAELDEHAEGVNVSEIDVILNNDGQGRPRAVVLNDVREQLAKIPGLLTAVGQPISHRLDHLSSGVRAELAVKIFGPELPLLRRYAEQTRRTMAAIPGIVDLQVEPQVNVQQVVVTIKRSAAARYGFRPAALVETLETAFNGHVVGQVLEGQRRYDLVVRFEPAARGGIEKLQQTLLATPAGPRLPLGQLADVRRGLGSNTINRENVSRRIVVQANVEGRDLNSVVRSLEQQMKIVQAGWEPGYFVDYGGQFESQQRAQRRLLFLGGLTIIAIYMALWVALQSWRLALQVIVNLPLALVGGVAAIFLTGGILSVASLVGFITLFGIATRNGILMLSHYVHLMEEEGEPFGPEMIVRGTLERLSPVLMTALTAALALLPIALASGQAGKELLQPIAVVICGGLITSTLLNQVVTPALFSLMGPESRESDAGDSLTV